MLATLLLPGSPRKKGRVRALLQGDLRGDCTAVRDEDRAQEHAREEPGAPKGVFVSSPGATKKVISAGECCCVSSVDSSNWFSPAAGAVADADRTSSACVKAELCIHCCCGLLSPRVCSSCCTEGFGLSSLEQEPFRGTATAEGISNLQQYTTATKTCLCGEVLWRSSTSYNLAWRTTVAVISMEDVPHGGECSRVRINVLFCRC